LPDRARQRTRGIQLGGPPRPWLSAEAPRCGVRYARTGVDRGLGSVHPARCGPAGGATHPISDEQRRSRKVPPRGGLQRGVTAGSRAEPLPADQSACMHRWPKESCRAGSARATLFSRRADCVLIHRAAGGRFHRRADVLSTSGCRERLGRSGILARSARGKALPPWFSVGWPGMRLCKARAIPTGSRRPRPTADVASSVWILPKGRMLVVLGSSLGGRGSTFRGVREEIGSRFFFFCLIFRGTSFRWGLAGAFTRRADGTCGSNARRRGQGGQGRWT